VLYKYLAPVLRVFALAN